MHAHRRRLKLGLAKRLCIARGKGGADTVGEPHRQPSTAGAGDMLTLAQRRIQRREIALRPLGHAPQHGVGKAGGAPRDGAHKLHPLAYRNLGGRPQIDDLERRNAQRRAYARGNLAGLR